MIPNVLRVFAIVGFGILLFSCDPEDEAFRTAQSENTIESYEKYVADYPENQNGVTVDNQLDNLYFQRVKKEPTEANFQAYLDHFPKGRHAGDVRAQSEKMMYRSADKTNSLAGWNRFIDAYPHGNYTRKATLRRDELVYFGKLTFQESSVEEVNLAGDRRGAMDGYAVSGTVVNGGNKTLTELTVEIAPKGKKDGVLVKVDLGEGMAPGADSNFAGQFSDAPDGWDGSTLRLRVTHVAFGKK